MLEFRNSFTSPATYDSIRFTFISSAEGYTSTVDNDGAGYPSIGIGFKLKDDNVRNWVLQEVTGNNVPAGLDTDIRNIVAAGWIAGSGGTVDQINAKMAAAHISNANVPTTLTVSTTQANTIYQNIVGTYEGRVNAKISGVDQSYERAALVSLTYNNADLIGPNLQKAIKEGNRAEAWYEIRYQSNSPNQAQNILEGIAKRRYYESEMFSLYKDIHHVTDKEARDVYAMYERHQEYNANNRILNYDNAYSKMIDTNVDIHGNPVNANHDYNKSILQAGEVQTLSESMSYAHDYLVNKYSHGQAIDHIFVDYIPEGGNSETNTFSGTSGNDLILGGSGINILSGGNGDDIFVIDPGADYASTYSGGAGSDTVDFSQGIYAIQGLNFNGINLSDSSTWTSIENLIGTSASEIVQDNASNNYIDLKGFVSVNGVDLVNLHSGGSDTVVWGAGYGALEVIDAQNDDVIKLKGITTADLVGYMNSYHLDPDKQGNNNVNFIIGTKLPIPRDSDWVSILIHDIRSDYSIRDFHDVSASELPVFENPDGTRVSILSVIIDDQPLWNIYSNDVDGHNLTGTSGDDTFMGSAGNDTVNADAGNDIISGSGGNDTINGGSGNDIVHGNADGDNAIYNYAENKTATDQYYGDQGNDTLTLSFNSSDLTSTIKLDIVNYRNFITTPANIDLNSDTGSEYQFTSFGLKAGRFENLLFQLDGLTTSITVDGKDDNFIGALNTNISGNLLSDNGNGADTGFLSSLQVAAGTFLTSQGGSITIASNGAFTYAPGASFVGADSFTYLVDDNHGTNGSAVAHFFVGVSTTINGTSGNDTLTGTNVNEVLIGGIGNDTINGNDGNDILYGGVGSDAMAGGNGNDIYLVDNISDSVTEALNAGTDTVQTTITYTLATNVENLLLDGAVTINGTGNTLNNSITGNSANNILDGGSGNDTLIGGRGNDTFIVDSISDLIVENSNEGIDTISHRTPNDYTMPTNVENMTMDRPDNMNGWGNALDNIISGTAFTNNIYGNDGNDTLYGFAGNDNLIGGNGNDYLDGGAGLDSMIGGAGNDTMVIDSLSDSLTENVNEGIDTVISSITYTLAANFENLTLTGAANINATGNSVNNVVIGNDGNNTLDGGTGSDTLSGGKGDDIFIVDNSLDTVTENAAEGNDTVQSFVAFTLGTNIENLTLTGSSSVNGTGNNSDNYIIGNSGANTLTGLDGNDQLDGGTGNDTLIGGLGNDIYIVDTILDVVTENANEGIDTVLSRTTVDYTLPSNIENLNLDRADNMNGTGNNLDNVINGTAFVNIIYGLDGNDVINGLAGNDSLYGGDGNDTIDGGTGNDTMVGGTGNDIYYVDSISDSITENTNEGIDLVQAAVSYTLSTNLENLILTGTGNISGTGNATDNILTGNSGNNTLDGNSGNDYIDGGAGADNLYGGAGDDIFIVDNTGDSVVENANAGTDTVFSSVTYTLSSNVENLTLTGVANINGTGNSLANIIVGNDGNNTLDGGAGNDTLIGGKGNDIYIVDSVSDVVTENANEGTDTVQTAITFTLSYANVENLTLTGTSAINGTGNAFDNYITGNSGANTLTGGGGNDTLDGGAGVDTLVGGTGNDSYIVDSVSDVISENAGEGIDTVSHRTPNYYTLGANIENMTMDRPDNMDGWGNSLDNVITGTAFMNNIYGYDGNDSLYGFAGNDNLIGGNGNDFLDGGAGIDSMLGGAGDDTMVVDSASDSLTENVGEGTDTVQSWITYTLAANFENLTLLGASNLNGTGNSANNILTGNSAANTLDGGAGIDTLIGGTGNDIYVVDSTTDTIIENSGEGTDLIQSSVSYTLTAANVENLLLSGTAAINGTGDNSDNVISGNSGINTLTGNGGNDTLDGGAGNDTLIGGTGNDTYYVDSISDIVTENANEGIDHVLVTVSANYTLSANIENLTLLNTSNYDGTGNSLDNIIHGNANVNGLYGLDGNDQLFGGGGNDNLYGGNGNDTLDGEAGADTMNGGAGNDTFIVDNISDSVTEALNEGTDIVLSSVTHTLSSNVENLTLTGTSAINGTGNGIDNVLLGNGAANTLSGGGGNDTLNGGAGADTLTGGTGQDKFVFDQTSLSAADIISDYNASTENDILNLKDLLTGFTPSTSIISDFVHLTQSGSNMLLSVDTDGIGSAHSFQNIATLNNVSGLDVDTLYGAGKIVVN